MVQCNPTHLPSPLLPLFHLLAAVSSGPWAAAAAAAAAVCVYVCAGDVNVCVRESVSEGRFVAGCQGEVVQAGGGGEG